MRTAQLGGAPEAIGLAELTITTDAPAFGEIAMLVRDDLQGHGVGAILAQQLVAVGRARGLAELHADLLPGNSAALRLLRRLRLSYRVSFVNRLMRAVIPLAAASPVAVG